MHRDTDGRRVAVVVVAITALSLALRWLIPVNPSALAVAFDEGLFQRLAVSLARGEWLGTFSTTTLAKGPAYPAFVAASDWLHLPLQVAQQGLYLGGSMAIAGCVWVVCRRPWLAVAAYAVLAFDPVNYNAMSASITRDNIYTGLALGFVGGAFLTMHALLRNRHPAIVIALAAATGLSGSAFYLTREEGPWVAPALGLIVIGVVVLRVLARSPALSSRVRPVVPAGAAVVVLIALVAPIAFVHNRNAEVYGAGLTTDLTRGTFPKAYATWSRIRNVPLRAYVPINEAQRRAAYRVSPAAKQLEPFLEDPSNGWKSWGCPDNPDAARRDDAKLNICDDYPGGAAPWALRDAAAAAGHFGDASSFQKFFARVDVELRDACSDGRLRCERALPTSLQLSQRASLAGVTRSVAKWFPKLIRHASIYELYGPGYVNPMPAAERRFVRAVVPGTPRTDATARTDARTYQSRRWPHLALGLIYRPLVILLVALALAKLAFAVMPRNRFRSGTPLILAGALLSAVTLRLVIFGIVDTTQYLNHIRYQVVTRSFLLASVLVVLAAPTRASWIGRLRRLRSPSSA